MRLGPIEFASPWLLLGLLAAGIPLLLHLLSSRRARETPFPTLRFLQISARRTARRRRIRHWLLLLLRSGLLALLAVAVARLIVHASPVGFGDNYAAVLILDNSASMQTAAGPTSRFGRASAAMTELLTGKAPPAAAAWMATCDSSRPGHLSANVSPIADEVASVGPTGGRADMAACIHHAAELLAARGESDKRVYVFTDLQQTNFAGMAADASPGAVRFMIVDAGAGRPTNAGITDLTVEGRRVVDQTLTFAAELRTTAAADATVTVRLQVDGTTVGSPRTVTVRGGDESAAEPTIVRFGHLFSREGVYTGRVVIDEADDLVADNQRWFSVKIAERARALIVAGPAQHASHDDAGKVLLYALDPRTQPTTPWSVRPRLVRAGSWRPTDLEGMDAVFCANVTSFAPDQVAALADFAGRGGRVVLFCGAEVNANVYNHQLGDILPGRLADPVGRVGPDAPAVALGEVAAKHSYFQRLEPVAAELRQILTQRYFPIEQLGADTEVLLRLANGDPLTVSRRLGRGRVILCTTTASLQWTNLPSVGMSLFVPMLERICLDRPDAQPPPAAWTVGETVRIKADGDAEITGPGGPVALEQIDQVGVYRWTAGVDGSIEGAFAVNTDGAEYDLRPALPADLQERFGEDRTFIGSGVADVHAAAADRAAGMSLSEPLLVLVIVLLVLETRLANRRRRAAETH